VHAVLRGISVIPIVTIDRERDAVPLARALRRGGLQSIEVRWSSPAANAAIRAIASQLPQVVVGAGGLLRAADVAAAARAGARFLAGAGMTPELAASALASELPYLPGVATPSEIMAARALGICVMQLFPAEALGGSALLQALAPIFPGIAFRPAGGIDEQRVAGYLASPNVAAVGVEWITPPDAIRAGDWPRIRRLAERAAAFGQRSQAA
jgi:2-dehydro-3-deoxyphosphogluconate aldolase / (4S)-4-hydroxy-2-oxoglutarate aldolase